MMDHLWAYFITGGAAKLRPTGKTARGRSFSGDHARAFGPVPVGRAFGAP
ncbi:MAG: hypothetical protein FWD06_08785 [Oscillospiraceae bacterium]|nr:hypothetical protein [Oscillospiraceae bacterium]